VIVNNTNFEEVLSNIGYRLEHILSNLYIN